LSSNLSIKVRSDREELDGITAAVEAFSVDEDWSTDLLFKVNLVIEEIVLNIMDYGYDDDDHEIEIILNSDPETITIDITDEGRAFDPLNDAPEPDIDAPLEERHVGGLGVYLARTMMDELTYRREDSRNHLKLVKRREE
jgi:anti-sigma regulatory factor (Ser/Thr protein kinase)